MRAPWAIALAVIIFATSVFFTIKGSTECAAKGGTYIQGQGMMPACVAGVK